MKPGEYLHRCCPECPFQRSGPGRNPVRLRRGRISEIAGNILSPFGGEFPCHKTVDYDSDDHDEDGESCGRDTSGEHHCAGALIFAEKHDHTTQMMRIAERLGLYRPDELEGHDTVFDSVREWMRTALDAGKR